MRSPPSPDMQPLAHTSVAVLQFFSAPNLQGNEAARPQWSLTMAKTRTQRRWVTTVKTDSTHPPPRTFTGSASEIARKMARKDVSPKGLGSAIRMIQYFINRGGRRLSATRRRELERAKRILQKRRSSKLKRSPRTVVGRPRQHEGRRRRPVRATVGSHSA